MAIKVFLDPTQNFWLAKHTGEDGAACRRAQLPETLPTAYTALTTGVEVVRRLRILNPHTTVLEVIAI
jgi:hypothetical protein